MNFASGMKLGPYEILAPMGAGSMGEVYRARDARLDREVAIKVISNRVSHDVNAVSRFESEAKAIAALAHPNVLAIYDVGTQDGIPYVVTELLEGDTLAAPPSCLWFYIATQEYHPEPHHAAVQKHHYHPVLHLACQQQDYPLTQ